MESYRREFLFSFHSRCKMCNTHEYTFESNSIQFMFTRAREYRTYTPYILPTVYSVYSVHTAPPSHTDEYFVRLKWLYGCAMHNRCVLLAPMHSICHCCNQPTHLHICASICIMVCVCVCCRKHVNI